MTSIVFIPWIWLYACLFCVYSILHYQCFSSGTCLGWQIWGSLRLIYFVLTNFELQLKVIFRILLHEALTFLHSHTVYILMRNWNLNIETKVTFVWSNLLRKFSFEIYVLQINISYLVVTDVDTLVVVDVDTLELWWNNN